MARVTFGDGKSLRFCVRSKNKHKWLCKVSSQLKVSFKMWLQCGFVL